MNVQSELTRLSIDLYEGSADPVRTATKISQILAYSNGMPEADKKYYWDIVRARLPHFQYVSDN